MSNQREELGKRRDAVLGKARVIAEKARDEKRELTAAEADQVNAALAEAKRINETFAADERHRGIMGQLDAMAASATPNVLGGSGQKHVALTGVHAKSLASRIIDKMPRDAMGTKALASGVQTTSIVMLPDVVPSGRPPTSVLDLLPARIVEPSYSFLRQASRNLAAAPVASGGTKPTSTISVVGVQNRLRVVAHISEQIDHYLLSDNDNLARWVSDEMVWGLRTSVENEVLNGDGTGEHFTGILNTSGILSQAFATDALTSIRKGLTAIEISGYSASLIVTRPDTWEACELLAVTSGATDVRGLPVNSQERQLWGVPVVLAVASGLPAKTAVIIGDGAVTLDHDGRIDVRWSDAVGSDFTQNAVRVRTEGRFGVSVNQPGAVVKVATAA
jgi:HK97 family phage major capsid protein